MALTKLTDVEREFTAQRHEFLDAVKARYPSAPAKIADILKRQPEPLPALIVSDLADPTAAELELVVNSFLNGEGVVHIVPLKFELSAAGRHPLLEFASKLSVNLDIGVPVDHPMEQHPEAQRRFGRPDGTLKLYNLVIPESQDKYREQAETNQVFAAHNDGLGYAGLIRTSIITLDSAPLSGGYTYFQNLARLAVAIEAEDPDAYEALFLPDAITALRPRGKGAIRVTAPVYFLGRYGSPQIFFRIASGEYIITWRDHQALHRAREILETLSAPFASGSQFVHLMRPGDTAVIDNRHVVHGRTAFIDPPAGRGRVLARKWFVPEPEDAIYRHVPGIEVHSAWASLFPQQFSGDAIAGEWHYDPEERRNIRVDW